jgi:hypothetical protein
VRLRLHYLMAAILGLALTQVASAAAPPGWIIAGDTPTNYVFAVDTATPVSGSKSASIAAKPTATSNGFGTLMQMIAADDYRGSRLRLSGYLRTANADRAQMWMRVDGPNHQVLAFDNMDSRPVIGTTGWRQYDIVLNVPQNGVDVAFGFFLAGRGEVWGADFKIEKVGAAVPVTSQGPILPRKPTNLDFEMAAAEAPFPVITAGNGRIFVYQTASSFGLPVQIKLNGKLVCTVVPNQLVFFDRPSGNYNVAAVQTGASGIGSAGGHPQFHDAPGTEHALTFHVNPGQVRYIRLDTRTSHSFVSQVYPELVDVAVGQAQTNKILKSAGFKIKSISKG